MSEQPRAQLDIDAAGGVAEDVAPEAVEHALADDHDQQAGDQYIERGEAAVHEHLVHHHLEEQRRDQREHLQRQADQQHLAEQPAVAHDRWDEPGEVEAGEFADEAGRGWR